MKEASREIIEYKFLRPDAALAARHPVLYSTSGAPKAASMLSRTRLAFTLVEILVATAIFTGILYVVVNIFLTGSRQTAMLLWYTKTQTELRNGLRWLREDLQKASNFTEITQARVNRGNEDQFAVLLPGTASPSDTLPPKFIKLDFSLKDNQEEGKKLLEFYMCKPRRAGFSDAENFPGEVVRGQLFADKNVLRYKRTRLKTPTPTGIPGGIINADGTTPVTIMIAGSVGARSDVEEAVLHNRPLIYDGDNIHVTATEAPKASATLAVSAKYLIFMRVQTAHPKYRETRVSEETLARVDVKCTVASP
jgi:type II secretory pathway pseudopilin PulG